MRTALALLLIALPAAAGAADRPCAPYLTAEAWTSRDHRIAGADLNVVECSSRHGAFRLGLSYYAYDDLFFEGVTGSYRLQAGRRLVPYVGAGLLAGWAEVEEENEDGETYRRKELSAFVYPELGVMYLPNRSVGLAFTARRYFGHEFEGEPVYSVGVAIRIPP